MDERKTPLELGRRERQLVETVTKLGEASVSDVLENLANPPSYSSVRAMLGLLVEKKWLKFRRSKTNHFSTLHSCTLDSDFERLTVLQHLLLGMNAHINLDLAVTVSNVATPETLDKLKDDFVLEPKSAPKKNKL